MKCFIKPLLGQCRFYSHVQTLSFYEDAHKKTDTCIISNFSD